MTSQARQARIRDRATRAVAPVSAAATAGTVAATMGVATALTPPPAPPTPAGVESSATPTSRDGSLALRRPGRAPESTRRDGKRPNRDQAVRQDQQLQQQPAPQQDAPRTSAS